MTPPRPPATAAPGDGVRLTEASVWHISHRADPRANAVAKRHYTCQSPDSPQFVPPGRCLVLRTDNYSALWVTSWPIAAYVKHAWAGAWVCSLFRNESGGAYLSSALIREAVAMTRWRWPDVPEFGMVTFVDATKTRRKRDPGRCYRRAGFKPAACPVHPDTISSCAACQGRTAGGLVALQLWPDAMPEPMTPAMYQPDLFAGVAS